MHGVFYNALNQSFPIHNHLNISVSDNYYNNSLPYEKLIENIEHPYGWASKWNPNAFLEIKLYKSILFFQGYSLMTPSQEDDIIRNWRVDCLEDGSYITVDNRKNDISLCPNSKKIGDICNMYDKKLFLLDKGHYCKSIKIVLTGLTAAEQYYIVLSAIDFSGFLCICNDCIPRYKTLNVCWNQISSFYFNIYVIILL